MVAEEQPKLPVSAIALLETGSAVLMYSSTTAASIFFFLSLKAISRILL